MQRAAKHDLPTLDLSYAHGGKNTQYTTGTYFLTTTL